MSEAALNIVAVGEPKGSKLTKADKGQVEQYLHCLLEAQKFRHIAFCFLTNNDDFWLVRANRCEDEKIKCIWFSKVKFGGLFQYGEKALSWFAGLTLKDHGYYLPVTLVHLYTG